MKPETLSFFRRAFLRHGPRRFAVMQPESADRKYNDHPGELTDPQIAAHLAGRAAYAVPTAENGLAHLLPFDIDAGGETAARALLDAAAERGHWAFAQVDTERGRGYVWLPFNDLTNAARLHALGEQLLAQVIRPGWKIENRATAEDTRLPFARHRWTGRCGVLLTQDGTAADLDTGDLAAILGDFSTRYRENPTSTLPPPPEPRATPEQRPETPGQGVTIDAYNASTDLGTLLEHYGAKPARGRGARLYFCPFHGDNHASLLLTRDGDRCHCLSRGSGCPLAEHQNDAFNVFCAGERISPQQALRRLNGQPDDPEPNKGGSGTFKGHQTPPAALRETKAHREGYETTPRRVSTVVRPSYGRTEGVERPRTAHAHPELPKSARRVLDYLHEQPGDYIRGKYHLAAVLDIDPRTVQRSLRRLEAEGLITRTQRGRDGQTDIYRPARGGAAHEAERRAAKPNRVDEAPPAAPEPANPAEEGRQMSPTGVLEYTPIPKALEAERGGQPGALDPDGAHHGPGGAIVYPGGAAYVPPEAEGWYSTLAPDVRGEQPAPPPTGDGTRQGGEAKPEPLALDLASPDMQGGASQTAREARLIPQGEKSAKRRRRKSEGARYVDPGRLTGRIIAATRKAEKLERGSAAERRQAKAIRRSIESLERQLETARTEQQARGYTAEECDRWHAERQQALGQRQPPGVAGGERTPPLTSSGASFPGSAPPSVAPDLNFAKIAQGMAERLRARVSSQ
jgi:DNA-binding MarR family transcriptional regulator